MPRHLFILLRVTLTVVSNLHVEFLQLTSKLLAFSSIGMAKAALETITGENLYGWRGASWTVIYVDIDAHNRNRTIFDTILPRESASKVFGIRLCSLSMDE